MSKSITRRDFLNGVSIGIAAAALGPQKLMAQAISSSSNTIDSHYYPPTLTGLRGSHPGSFENAHKLAWLGQKPATYQPLDEEYDLVVVGGGISGLAAAFFYQQFHGKDKRILILDNHDDFGGHAKRNEFHSDGKMLLGFGGSVNIEGYDHYSDVSKQLLADIGVDMEALEKSVDPDYPFRSFGTTMGMFTKARDDQPANIVNAKWMHIFHGSTDETDIIKAIQELSLTQDDKDKLLDLCLGRKDFLPGMTISQSWNYIETHSYYDFLRHKVGLSDDAIILFDPPMQINEGVRGDSLSAMEAAENGAPVLNGIGNTGKMAEGMVYNPDRPYTAEFFPDGNASITRLLIRKMIPAVAPGDTMHDIVDAKFDYSKLDAADSPVRMRLNSTAVNVEERDGWVNVSYITEDKPLQVRAKKAILACYNGLIPHLCPQLPEEQKEALKYGVKVPFLWTNVLLRDGTPFYKAGSEFYYCPGSEFSLVTKAPSSKLGNYQSPNQEGDPLVVFMAGCPSPQNNGSQTARDLFRLGRHKIYATPFEEIERQVRAQLTEMFGPYGFDADRDIEAITVNRWSHGYAYIGYQLYDRHWEEGLHPHQIGRRAFGNISIANSDSEATAFVKGAIDAAWRAVNEQS